MMKKLLFLLGTLFYVQVAMAEYVSIASYTFPDQQLSDAGSKKTGSGSNIAGTNCTVTYYGVGGENSSGMAIHIILNEKYYHKFNGDNSYVTIKRTSGSFVEGDKFTATMYAGNSSKTDGFYFKTRAEGGNSQTIATSTSAEVTLEYQLKSADINDDGSVTVYRYSTNCYVRSIDILHDDGVEKSTATTSFGTAQLGFTLSAGTSTGQTVTTNSTGTVTYSSSKETVVTVDPSTGALTAVAVGKATITATVASDNNYYSSSATYTVYVLSDGVGTLASPYCPTDFRYHAEKADLAADTKAWVKGYIVGVYNSTDQEVKMVTSTTNTEGTIGLGNSADETVGVNCVSVQLITDSNPRLYLNLKGNAEMLKKEVWVYGKVGSFTASSQTVYGLAHADDFRYGADELSVAIGSTGYATFSAMRGYALPEGLDAYITSSLDGGKVTLTKIEGKVIPAFTGVILKGASQTLTADETTVDVSSNTLKANLKAATLPETSGDYTNFILVSDGAGGVKFVKSNGSTADADKLPANRAYLQLLTSSIAGARELSISFGDSEITGVNNVRSEETGDQSQYFDLQGRKVAKPAKGLYIVNGKKYVVK